MLTPALTAGCFLAYFALRASNLRKKNSATPKVKNADAMPIVGAVYLQVRRCKQ